MHKNCWLIGAGYMAREYVRALNYLKLDFQVISRGNSKSNSLSDEFKINVVPGGIRNAIKEGFAKPEFVIIAVSVDNLTAVLMNVIELGIPNILVEKPAALEISEFDKIISMSKVKGINIFVAYNRRFYASLEILKNKIEEDGGIQSVNFEFTEWIHTIDTHKFSPIVLDKFLIANSTHVIDTVFHLIGPPKEITCYVRGESVKWHTSGSIFAGCGLSENDVLFTYSSNWGSPGRWGIEICTSKRRYYLKPLERLSVQELGSVEINQVEIDYSLDIDYKPGIINMLKSFFSHEHENLCGINEHKYNFKYFEKIAGYK